MPWRVVRLGTIRSDFERAVADPADPAIVVAEIAHEHRMGADYVRVPSQLVPLPPMWPTR